MIKMIIMDIDGTMTDGKLYIGPTGEVFKAFNVKDGMGIAQARKLGIHVVIMTGRTSEIVRNRANELGIQHIYQGIGNKPDKIITLAKEFNVNLPEMVYIGDDLNDLEAIKMVGFSACPKDASEYVKKNVDFISKYNGGEGAIREVIEYIFTIENRWEQLIGNFDFKIQ